MLLKCRGFIVLAIYFSASAFFGQLPTVSWPVTRRGSVLRALLGWGRMGWHYYSTVGSPLWAAKYEKGL